MRKKDDIAEIYKKRKDEFILMPPEDGWEKLGKELPSSPKRLSLPYGRMAVAAVVLLCVSMLIPFLIPRENPKELSAIPEIAQEQQATVPEQPYLSSIEDVTPPQEQIERISATTGKQPVLLSKKENTGEEKEIHIAINEPEVTVDPKQEEPNKITRSKTGPEPSSQPVRIKDNSTKRERVKVGKRWSVGLIVGSNSIASAGSPNRYVFVPPTDEDYLESGDGDDKEGDDGGEKGNDIDTKSIVALRNEKEKDITYSHRLPLTASLRLSHYLSEKLAIETGLSFTYLSADIKHLSVEKGEQAVYYLGVPVKANWSFYRSGRFQAYLSGGAMLEYCLSAQQKLGDDKVSLDINRWQWSLHAAGGAQLDIVRPLSLFIEPGVSYYFEQNKNRPFETSRTEHPLSFSLQFGVRFTY